MRHRRAARIGLVLALLALPGVPAHSQVPGRRLGEKYALLIAVRQYEPSELRSLKYTEADIDALAEVLVNAGYLKENLRVMTQTRGAERARLLPTAANIRTELGLMLKNMDEADRVVVALAGHGVQLAGGEESYFCPADARLNDTSTLIPLGQVYAALERCGAGSKVLLVDACRNDPLTAQARDAGRPVVDLPSLTRPLKKRPLGGVAALFSCSEGERAFEHPDLKHGVFFHFVIQGLQGEADFDGDGTVDFDELATYTKRRVYRFVEGAYRVEQTPELLGKSNLIELVSLARARVPDVPKPVTTTRPERPAGPETITNTLGMKLVLIPKGEFLMGSPDSDQDAQDDEKPPHRVRITRPFYLGTTEVTVGQFRRVVEATGLRTEAETDGKGGIGWNEAKGRFEQDPKYTWRNPGFAQTDEHPVVEVSWNDAIAFCNKLSDMEGLKPYYQFGAGSQSGGDGYRLPTEAEWEYACRAGSTTRYNFGDDAVRLPSFAWTADNSGREMWDSNQFWNDSGKDYLKYFVEVMRRGCRSHPVSQKQQNAFGVYDMHGNVWELCWDGYKADYYKESPGADPLGPSQAAFRVYRGGGWNDGPRICRSAFRGGFAPVFRLLGLGFRVARVQSVR